MKTDGYSDYIHRTQSATQTQTHTYAIPGNSTTYLHNLVPASRHDDRVLRAWTEANAAHPLRVAVLGNVKLAVAKRVPQLDGTVTTSGHNLAVVGAKAHTENVASVTNKATRCLTRVQVPETEGLVPRGRQSKLAVRRDHHIRHKVIVTVQNLLRVAVVGVIARELPDDNRLVTRSCQQEVWVLLRRSNGRHPTLVARQATLVSERLRPVQWLVMPGQWMNMLSSEIHTCRSMPEVLGVASGGTNNLIRPPKSRTLSTDFAK